VFVNLSPTPDDDDDDVTVIPAPKPADNVPAGLTPKLVDGALLRP